MLLDKKEKTSPAIWIWTKPDRNLWFFRGGPNFKGPSFCLFDYQITQFERGMQGHLVWLSCSRSFFRLFFYGDEVMNSTSWVGQQNFVSPGSQLFETIQKSSPKARCEVTVGSILRGCWIASSFKNIYVLLLSCPLGPHHFCFKDVGNGVGLALGFKELVLHNYTANQAWKPMANNSGQFLPSKTLPVGGPNFNLCQKKCPAR